MTVCHVHICYRCASTSVSMSHMNICTYTGYHCIQHTLNVYCNTHFECMCINYGTCAHLYCDYFCVPVRRVPVRRVPVHPVFYNVCTVLPLTGTTRVALQPCTGTS